MASLKMERHARPFEEVLRAREFAVIAEVKRKSPSAGQLSPIFDPVALAKDYIRGGAAAISVLTDREGFGGSLDDLRQVAALSAPVLRKDFLIDPVQLLESAKAGAAAVLLIVALLGEQTGPMLRAAEDLGLEALVEVHMEEELKIAMAAGARIIGVNNRDLATLQIGPLIPSTVVKVAESGIFGPNDAARMQRSGFDAVLVGTALVTATAPAQFLRSVVAP